MSETNLFGEALLPEDPVARGSRIIAGVSVDNRGSNRGHLSPMLAQIQSCTGRMPDEMLADGGPLSDRPQAFASEG